MEKVFLRVYNREIASMIEGGHLDEAIAHCQHILKTFPMHIETYRLLGKAFLEGRRYADAAEIFQRVLLSVPDDFVSQVGMSIIRDNEGKLNDAIWHMERAFEVQPSNSAIQGELRRLYGRRDGVEPPKIRLSRDALANMYLQGELFNQAIAEIRSILAEDPNRPDLQGMLLRAYFRSGQKAEATEMASALLKKYLYNLDALRVLVDLLPETAHAEYAQVYRRRLLLLDPYSSFAIDSAFASDQVSDSAVSLERLDYKAGETPGSFQADLSPLSEIMMNTEIRPEPTPDSLKTSETVESLGAVTPESSGIEITAAAGIVADSVPAEIQSDNHLDSIGKAKDGSIDTGEALPERPINNLVIPDWLMPMAATKIIEKENIMSEESSDEPMGNDSYPDWLKPLVAAEGVDPAQIQSHGIDSSPESREEIKPIGAVETAKETSIDSHESFEPQPASGEDMPDLLSTTAPEEAAGETPPAPQELVKPLGESTLPAEATGTLNVLSEPALLHGLRMESGAEPVPAETPSADEKPFPDWLLAGQDSHTAEVAPSAAETMGQPATGEQPFAEQSIPEQPVPEQPVPEQPVPEQPVLERLVPEQLVSEEPIAEQPVVEQLVSDQSAPTEPTAQEMVKPLISGPVRNPPETLPLEELDDLSAGISASTSGRTIEETLPIQEEVLSSSESPAETATQPEVQTARGEEDMIAWLERLSADQETTPEVPLVNPEENPETTPGVNQEISGEQPAVRVAEESVPVPASTEPAEKIEEATGIVSAELSPEVKPTAPVGELPDWLKGLESPTSPLETPNTGDDMSAWLRQPIASGEDVPGFLKSLAPAEVAGEAIIEPQEPVGAQPASGEAIQESQKTTVPLEAHGGSNVVSEEKLPNFPSVEAGAEPAPEAKSSADEKPFPDWFMGMGTAVAAAIPSADDIMSKPAVGGQPIAEGPVSEQVVAEQPVPEQSIPEESVSEQAFVERPVSEQVVAEQPVPEQSIPEESVSEQAFAEQPVSKQVIIEQPVAEQTASEQPVSEQSVAEQLIPEQAITEQPVLEQPVPEQPILEQAVVEQPAPEQPIHEKSITEQLFPEQAISEQPAFEQPVVQEPVESQISTSGTVGESFQPSVEGKPLIIGDDTLGWLENMAVKQGAKPEELMSNPLDRSQEKPDWLQQLGEEQPEPSIAPIQEPGRNPPETLPLEELGDLSAGVSTSLSSQSSEEAIPVQEEVPPPSELSAEIAPQPVVQPARGEEDRMIWQERELTDQEPTPEVTLVSPEENLETMPEINQEILAEQPPVHAVEESVPVPASIEPVEKVGEMTSEASAELPHEEEPAAPVGELPDWLSGLESPATLVETPATGDDMPEWLRQPIVGGENIPDFLKSMAPAEVAGEVMVEPQEPIEPQPTGGEPIQGSQETTVPVEVPGGSNVISEGMIPEVVGKESGNEPTSAETPFSDIEAFPDWLNGMENLTAEGQPVAKQPVSEQPLPEQPVLEQPVSEQRVPGQPLSEHPISEQPVLEQPVSEQAIPEQAVAEQPVSELPAPEQLIAEQPVPIEPATQLVTRLAEDKEEGRLKELEISTTPLEAPKVSKKFSTRQRHPISPVKPESVSEPEAPAWEDENIPVTGKTIPTLPEEWVPAEVKPDAGLEPKPIPETALVQENPLPAESRPSSETGPVSEPKQLVESKPVVKPASISGKRPVPPRPRKQMGKLSSIPVKDKDAGLLSSAQTYLDQDSLSESMNQYSKLIKKGRLLDEVIFDLREGIHRNPVDVNIWQTLGDAYMRANRLQDALDAYTKAEELLQ